MLDVAGQDATEAFEDVGHSDEARETLAKLQVGVLKRNVSLSISTVCSSHCSIGRTRPLMRLFSLLTWAPSARRPNPQALVCPWCARAKGRHEGRRHGHEPVCHCRRRRPDRLPHLPVPAAATGEAGLSCSFSSYIRSKPFRLAFT